jgi:hypothetical protein
VYPSSNHVCSTARLASRQHALRPCVRQPRGCHCNWLWPFVMLHATPQLSALPCPRSGCVESIDSILSSPPSIPQHECAVAPACWTPTCASRPRTTCSIGYCRKQRGPPSGRTQLSRPAVVRPGTLRTGIPAGRRHLFSLVLLGPLTRAVYTSPALVSVWDKDPATATPSSPPAPGSTQPL